MLNALLTILAAASATLEILAVYRGPVAAVYVFKPLTMVLIILIAVFAREPEYAAYRGLIVLGLCFSLVGDIFLMLPGDLFVPGLLSFLIAHLFYTFGFVYMTGRISSLLYTTPFLLYGGVMMWILLPHVGGFMKLPVMVYMIVILAMAWQAFNRWIVTRQKGSLLASIGAILFVASDSILAINRFAKPFPEAPSLILSTYFAAQWLIAISTTAPNLKFFDRASRSGPNRISQRSEVERATRH
ncbi:MAG TPA: lysoplasmalogenase [Blastocatellia bacterium]|nr:lysoplasmalogenase [Blastocatellia bacterium]